MDNMVEGMHKYFGAERSTHINVEMLGCINKNAFQWTNQYYIDYSLNSEDTLFDASQKQNDIFWGETRRRKWK